MIFCLGGIGGQKKFLFFALFLVFGFFIISSCSSKNDNKGNLDDQGKIELIGIWKGEETTNWKDVLFEFCEGGCLIYTDENGIQQEGRYVTLEEGQFRVDLLDIFGPNFPTIWGYGIEDDTLFLDFQRDGNPVPFKRYFFSLVEKVDQTNTEQSIRSEDEIIDDNFIFNEIGCEISIYPYAIFISDSSTAGMQKLQIAFATSINLDNFREGYLPKKINPCFQIYETSSNIERAYLPLLTKLDTRQGYEYYSSENKIPIPKYAIPSGVKYYVSGSYPPHFRNNDFNLISFEVAENVIPKKLVILNMDGEIQKEFDLENLPINMKVYLEMTTSNEVRFFFQKIQRLHLLLE